MHSSILYMYIYIYIYIYSMFIYSIYSIYGTTTNTTTTAATSTGSTITTITYIIDDVRRQVIFVILYCKIYWYIVVNITELCWNQNCKVPTFYMV